MGRMRYEPLATHPLLDLKLVVPRLWREYGTTYSAEPAAGHLDVTALPARWLSVGPAKWYLHHYRGLSRFLQLHRPDVIHLWEEPWSLVALQATLLRNRFLPNAALVFETDQNILRRLPPPFEWIRRWTLRRADLLIARQDEAAAVSRSCGYTGVTRFVAYGVDAEIFKVGSRLQARQALGIPENCFALGYVGRIVRSKGIFDVLNALANAPPDTLFLLLGGGPDKADFIRQSELMGVAQRVRLLDPVGPEGVADFIRALDVLLLLSRTLPTWKEQFGRVIIEAQACGVPVIGSDSGSIPEVVGEGGWIIPEGDIRSFSDLLMRLRRDPSEVRRAAEAGLANVATRYTYERVGEQLFDVYVTAASVAAVRSGGSNGSIGSMSPSTRSADFSPDGTSGSGRSLRVLPADVPTTGPAVLPNVVVVHETDGLKYLEALAVLSRRGAIGGVAFHGASVLWRFAHCILRDRLPVGRALRIASRNLRFQMKLPFIRGKTVIIALAPWDFRLLWLMFLLRGNRIIYNTSWPWWTGERVPRRYGMLTPLYRRAFCAALSHSGIDAVAVTQEAADSLALRVPGLRPRVISHVVSDVFFRHRAQYQRPCKLLIVSELSEKKGLRDIIEIGRQLGDAIEIDIVGDGPLRGLAEEVARLPGRRFHGKISDRARLAEIAGGAQIFVSLPHRTARWEELFGMAVVEAMAVGLPCIVSNHIGPRGIITHGRDGYLAEEGDLASVLGWIRQLMDDPMLWSRIGARAAERARCYSMEAVANQWLGVIMGRRADAVAPGLPEKLSSESLLTAAPLS